MMKIYLLTGEINSGKTTRLKDWIINEGKLSSIAGILSPVINKKRYFFSFPHGSIIPMETDELSDQLSTGKYFFSKNAFQKARQVLKESLYGSSRWIIIDEFGKLELQDQGLNPVITEIIGSGIDKNVLIVIRSSLINDFLDKYNLTDSDYELFNFQTLRIPAFIIAGGKSTRMGTDKSLLKIGNEPVILRIYKQLRKFFMDVQVISNSDYREIGIDSHMDLIKGFGPLSGIHAVLGYSEMQFNFITTSDMLLLSDGLLNFFAHYQTSAPALMFRDKNFIHPFPGIYSSSLKEFLEKYLLTAGQNRKRIYDVIKSFASVKVLDTESLNFIEDNTFMNMNTPEDYQNILLFLKP